MPSRAGFSAISVHNWKFARRVSPHFVRSTPGNKRCTNTNTWLSRSFASARSSNVPNGTLLPTSDKSVVPPPVQTNFWTVDANGCMSTATLCPAHVSCWTARAPCSPTKRRNLLAHYGHPPQGMDERTCAGTSGHLWRQSTGLAQAVAPLPARTGTVDRIRAHPFSAEARGRRDRAASDTPGPGQVLRRPGHTTETDTLQPPAARNTLHRACLFPAAHAVAHL